MDLKIKRWRSECRVPLKEFCIPFLTTLSSVHLEYLLFKRTMSPSGNTIELEPKGYVLVFYWRHNKSLNFVFSIMQINYLTSSVGQKSNLDLMVLESRCQQGPFLYRGSRGESLSLIFATSRGYAHSFTHGSIPSSSKLAILHISSSFFHSHNSLCLSFFCLFCPF